MSNNALSAICLSPQATLREAMEAINRGGIEIALMLDGEKLVGTLTDGDVRRALLKGAVLTDSAAPFVNLRYSSVREGVGRAEVLDLMRARALQQIPIVDAESRLLGIHLLREILGSVERPNWAVLMAGGRGERLRPLTDTIPKPMIRVAGRPILERLVLHCVGAGIRKIFLSVNYLSGVVREHFGDGSGFGCEIAYLEEDTPLGTAGALALLPGSPEHPILVANGDLITDFDASAMFVWHESRGHALTVGTREYRHTIPFGVVELDGERVAGLREKPTLVSVANAGVYVVDPPLLGRIPRGREFTMPELIENCLATGDSVGAYAIQGDWIDVGRPADLQVARGL